MFTLASAQAQQPSPLPVAAPVSQMGGLQRPQTPGFNNPAVSQLLRAPAPQAGSLGQPQPMGSPVSKFAPGPQMAGNPDPRVSAPMGGAAVSGLGQPQPMGKPMPLGAPGLGGFGKPGLGGKPSKGGAGGGGKARIGQPPVFRQ